MSGPQVQTGSFAASHRFATTRWTLVCAAAAPQRDANSRAALSSLCQTYWYPLYAFIRHRGHDADAAGDLTQGFFATLLEKNYLADADRSRGRFRTFLLASLKHYLANEHDRAARLKRGGGKPVIPLDRDDAESRYRAEPSHDLTPDRLFERRWAITLLDQVLSQLREDYGHEGKQTLFDALKGALTCSDDADSYAQVAREQGMTEGAVRVAVHRLRKRYRQRLREAIADCVESEQDIDDEIRSLFEALATPAG
jgi:RNA polymerase sigma-70 factor (ECF subfamily)